MTITIDSILAKLDPKTRARVQSAQDIQIEKQLTPSIGLNFALRGGLGYGRQALVWGNKSAGKSSFCLQMIALAQKEGKVCAWIDAEASYDQAWAETLGVGSSKLIYSPAKTVNDMVDVATKLMDAEVDLIVVDSISALLPAIYFEKDGNEMKDLQDTKQIGAEAKDMTHAVKMLNYANKNTLLVLISQQRNQFGSMHASHIPTGGMAVKFFSSTVIKLWGPPNLSGQYDFYYQGETIGVDRVGETLDVAEMCGIVEKGGAWYTVNGERLQGRAKAVAYLKENPDVVLKMVEEINAKY